MGRAKDGEDQGLNFNNEWGNRQVFNRQGFDGPPPEPPAEPWDDVAGVARVIALYRAVGLDLKTTGYAYFSPGDFDHQEHIGLPPAADFESATAWAGTALHELVHWAGHRCRLARDEKYHTPDGRAFEELVAELGASMLASQLRVAGTRIDDEQHGAYLTIWATRIQRDPSALQRALELADNTAAASTSDVPRVLRDGSVWRKQARESLVHQKMVEPIPPMVLGVESAVPVVKWFMAVLTWLEAPETDAPVLLLTGAPGDGTETLLAWSRGFMMGDSPVGMPLIWTDHGYLPWSIIQPRGRFEALDLPRFEGDANKLPAVAFPLAGNGGAGLPWAPPHQWRGRRSACERPPPCPDGRGRAVLERRRKTEQPKRVRRRGRGGASRGGGGALALVQARPSPVDRFGAPPPQSTRLLESWSNRLRSAQPWLDGRTHRVTDSLRRLRLRDSAPFSPAILQASQAVLDALARGGSPTPGLPELVDLALAQHPLSSPTTLLPLDLLAAPLFGGSCRTLGPGERNGISSDNATHPRMRFVVQLLQLCPELSLGSKSIALMLQTSIDQNIEQLASDVDTVGLNRATPSDGMGHLVRRSGSWSCDRALKAGRASAAP